MPVRLFEPKGANSKDAATFAYISAKFSGGNTILAAERRRLISKQRSNSRINTRTRRKEHVDSVGGVGQR
jgi:hypothetical protein